MVIITDLVDYVDESKGFFYLSRVQEEDKLEEVFSSLCKKIVNYFNN